MNAADWVDILQVIVPSLVGVVPAVLLYEQNKASSERESNDRQLERKADEERRAQDLEVKRLDIEHSQSAEARQAQDAATQRVRERYLRFLAAAQVVGLHWWAQEAFMSPKGPPETVRSELASAYEDALLAAPTGVRARMTTVKTFLDEFGPDKRTGIATTYMGLQASMMALRDAIRDHLEP